mmetsp:Transcript_42081/g.131170  ORF Transcript_42081/g.131170 Transcript_42081/m.131170 type:complete len:237 (-) Transcript_42081:565-1275(-)
MAESRASFKAAWTILRRTRGPVTFCRCGGIRRSTAARRCRCSPRGPQTSRAGSPAAAPRPWRLAARRPATRWMPCSRMPWRGGAGWRCSGCWLLTSAGCPAWPHRSGQSASGRASGSPCWSCAVRRTPAARRPVSGRRRSTPRGIWCFPSGSRTAPFRWSPAGSTRDSTHCRPWSASASTTSARSTTARSWMRSHCRGARRRRCPPTPSGTSSSSCTAARRTTSGRSAVSTRWTSR